MAQCKKLFTIKTFDLWLACRLRIAQLKPEIPVVSLWQRDNSLFDVQVFNVMTFLQFQWVNRQLSFADVQAEDDSNAEDAGDAEEEEDEENAEEEAADEEQQQADDDGNVDDAHHPLSSGDSHRKRRELTDLACKAFAAAWLTHQFVGLDEAVREHKHWGKMRIRFKAAVHSGSIVDSLNDCVTKYCLFFEEQHWLKRQPRPGGP